MSDEQHATHHVRLSSPYPHQWGTPPARDGARAAWVALNVRGARPLLPQCEVRQVSPRQPASDTRLVALENQWRGVRLLLRREAP